MTAFQAALVKGQSEMVQALLDKGADVNAKTRDGDTGLMFASQQNHLDLVRLLLAKGADVNARKENGASALMIASLFGHLGVVQVLLDKGADVSAKRDNGITALTAASINGHLSVVQALLDKGADANARSDNGLTTLMLACEKGGNLDVVQALLHAGADVNGKNSDGVTTLMKASHLGHIDVVQALLANRADVNAKANNGMTALEAATAGGHADVQALLVKAGAKLAKGADANAKDNDGITALIHASRQQSAPVPSAPAVQSTSFHAGELPKREMRYTTAGGTVYDTKTKLTWQQAISSSTYTWADAQTYCAGVSMSLGGTGWRLPTLVELKTIVRQFAGQPIDRFGSLPLDTGKSLLVFVSGNRLAIPRAARRLLPRHHRHQRRVLYVQCSLRARGSRDSTDY